MFNNLIESNSHAKEYKRRGSFLLFTGAVYVVLFVVTGVASIYAYDARLEEQTNELVVLLSPQAIVPERQPEPAAHPDRPRPSNTRESMVAVRTDPMLSVNRPDVVPHGVSARASTNPVLPEGPWRRGPYNYTPDSIGGPGGPTNGTRVAEQPAVSVELPDKPPPPPAPPKPPPVINQGVITSHAIFLPKPAYSEIAKRLRIQGTVTVQVLVDVDGKVISAKAVSGSAFLIPEATKAALQARFSPTLLSNQPVKVSGVITYNFVLGN